jgi:hypothetical protein
MSVWEGLEGKPAGGAPPATPLPPHPIPPKPPKPKTPAAPKSAVEMAKRLADEDAKHRATIAELRLEKAQLGPMSWTQRALIDARIAGAENERLKALRSLASLPLGARGTVQFSGIPPSLVARSREGADIVEAYTHPALLPKVGVVKLPGKGRAHYVSGDIHINAGTSPSTVAHEITHGTEIQNPAVLKASQDFLATRTAGEQPRQLKKLTGLNYKAHEMALEDEFAKRGGDHYCGKVYPDATELLTMGVERLHADPAAFAATDPDYFNFIVNTLRQW